MSSSPRGGRFGPAERDDFLSLPRALFGQGCRETPQAGVVYCILPIVLEWCGCPVVSAVTEILLTAQSGGTVLLLVLCFIVDEDGSQACSFVGL